MSPSQTPQMRAVTLAGVAVVVAALYFARTVFIPLALAILLTFLLAPLVVRLRRWGLGRIPSVITAVGAAFVVVGFLGWFMATQLYDVASKLPQYESNIHKKVRSFAIADGGVFGVAQHLVRQVNREISSAGTRPAEHEETTRSNAAPAKPIPVEIHQPEPTPVQVLRNLLKSLANPLTTAGIVIVFVLFMLVNREDLRDRLIRLIGAGELNRTTQALDDAAQRVSRFLLSQLIINLCFAIPVGLGLFFLGIPNALLWGLFAGLLRFIPYLGIWIAASMPAALALAVDPGWSKLLGTMGVFATMEVITYNFIEPWRYAICTGISSMAVLAAAVFWTWLWGPIGLLLSTPLTVCLVVVGRYVPHLEFLSVLLGDEPVLTPEARYYQRLLAMDGDEATNLAEQFINEHSVREFYEDMLIPALTMAEEDRHRGILDPERQRFFFDSTRRHIQELTDHQEERARATAKGADAEQGAAVLCLPAADEADELVALMLAKLLAERDVIVKTAPASALASERLGLVEEERVALVCISALPPGAVTPVKYLCKRLRAELPEVRIVVGYWQHDADLNRLQARIDSCLAEGIVTSLQQAVEQIAPMTPATVETAPLVATNETERLAALHQSGLLGHGMEEVFDRATRELAGVFNVAVAAAALVDEHEVVFKSHVGLNLNGDSIERDRSPCSHVVATNEMLSVRDTLKDARFANSAFLRENEIRFYAGVPLRTRAGCAIGALCLMDRQPRRLSERELALLDLIARQLMEEVQWRMGEHSQQPQMQPAGGER